MRMGAGYSPLLLGGSHWGVQLEGGGPLCVLRTQLSTETRAQACKSGDSHTHATHMESDSFSLSLQSRIPLTHPHTRTPLWCQCPHWSRCLDDIVKQLHGLHDVLILQRGKRCARVYVQFVALWRVMCRK